MLKVKIEGDVYKFPKGWEDITIKKYIQFQELIAKYGDDALKDFNESEDPSEFVLFCADIVSFWGDIPKEKINKCDINDVYKAFNELSKYFKEPSADDNFKSFKHKGIEYFLPKKLMKGSTLIEFLESSQLEKSSEELAGGNWAVMPKIIAILARKEGEEYDGDKLEIRAKLFESLTMDVVSNVAFFFNQTKQYITETFAVLFGGGADFKFVKAGGKELNDSYGWYLTLKQVAESGIFNLSGYTPIRSAEIADLYEVFTYLSACKAENDVQKRMMKQK